MSSHRLIQLLAVVILGGFAVAWWSYHQSYISVWCFFAAVSSMLVYLFVRQAGAVRAGEDTMIRTPVCDLMEIDHPIALGGMGSIYSPDLVAAVSNAGGLGAMGCHRLDEAGIRAGTAALRERTNKPFALNFLLFDLVEERFAAALALAPEGDGVRLAAAGAGSEVLCRPRARRRLQGDVHGQRRAGSGEGGRGGRRRHHRAGHRRRRPCRLGDEHGADADGGRCGCAYTRC